jgi:hypothetical protein
MAPLTSKACPSPASTACAPPKRPYSRLAIVFGLLIWGVGLKAGPQILSRQFGVTLQATTPRSGEGMGAVHQRRR